MSQRNQTDQRRRARELGIEVGVMPWGEGNGITDVPGVLVGHTTKAEGDRVRTGVTAILPHGGNIFQEKVPAAIAVGNGFGKLAGLTQVNELGTVETPIVLTNTLSVGTAVTAVVMHTLRQPGNEKVYSVNAVVGETNDGYLNDIRGLHVTEHDVWHAIDSATSSAVAEGCVGAGTGIVAFRFKSGIGTASRLVPRADSGNYTLGVLVQANYGGDLEINGAPVGRELQRVQQGDVVLSEDDGSCMIVVATDAPVSVRNLQRIAQRTFLGLARTGSYMSNATGDYAIAFSTAYRIPHNARQPLEVPPLVPNDAMTLFFQATVEATQEAVYNALFLATTTTGREERHISALPIDDVLRICGKYGVLNLRTTLGSDSPG